MARHIPTLLQTETQKFLALCYANDGRVIRHRDRLSVKTPTAYERQDIHFLKRMKQEGYLRITKSSTRTGRDIKLLSGDLIVEELVLTQRGESFGKASFEMKGEPLYYVMKGTEVVYGALRDYGLESVCDFSFRCDKNFRFIENMPVRLVPVSQRRKRNNKPYVVDTLAVYAGKRCLGAMTKPDSACLLKMCRFRPAQIEAWLTDKFEAFSSGQAVVLVRSKKMVGLPEQPTEATLKLALHL